MKNLIFLDIDGVLNCEEYYKAGRRDATYPISELCPTRVQILDDLCTGTNAYVVISSTWRHGRTEKELANILREAGFNGPVVGITPDMSKYSWACRGNEIMAWLKDNDRYNYDSYEKTDHSYVILDDDSDMLLQQQHNFFQCSPDTGLTTQIAWDIVKFFAKNN